jgi:predicted DNA-binding protein (MmcQ/YjbR family)
MQLLYVVSMDTKLTKIALAFPGTYMTEQWGGAHVFKVGMQTHFKMFAILRPGANRLTVKAPNAEIRAMLFEVGVAEAHSHMPRGNWMVLLLDKLDLEDVSERMRTSYDLVSSNLPKRVREALLK